MCEYIYVAIVGIFDCSVYSAHTSQIYYYVLGFDILVDVHKNI